MSAHHDALNSAVRRVDRLALWAILLCIAPSALASPGPATLRLAFDKTCYKPGDTLVASVILEGLSSPAAGFQTFLHFDDTKLALTGGSYTATPFGLGILPPNLATGGDVDLAAGINQLLGQSPTLTGGVLATLTFTAIGEPGCANPSLLTFRSHDPPTRVTDVDGLELLPLTLHDSASFEPGPATLRLTYDKPCYKPGETVVVSLRMEEVCSTAAGFEAYLWFDLSRLTFVSGTYTPVPFGAPTIAPILAAGDAIDLGANLSMGQFPSGVDATLATLTFTATGAIECASVQPAIGFRPHVPATRLINACGVPLAPLTLLDAPVIVPGPATLRLAYDQACYKPGDVITATLYLEDLCAPAAGFQAFLRFDDARLAFLDGAYTATPFGLPVITPIAAAGNEIDVASGINQLGGQSSTTTGGLVATLRFAAVASTDCSSASLLAFRPHDPPTRVTNVCGTELLPLSLIDPPPVAIDAPPVMACPAPVITVNAEVGGCSAVVALTPPTAMDACDGPVPVTFIREDGLLSLAAPFSSSFVGTGGPGVTKVIWRATDSCGQQTTCEQSVTVRAVNELRASVQLKGGGFPASLTRCITFELWDCHGVTPKATVKKELSFISGLASNVVFEIPCGSYTCITARDPLHTLRRTDADNFGVQPIIGTQYVADFTDRTGVGGDDDSLIGGNLNGDTFIDVVDFAYYAGEFLSNYGTGDTLCPAVIPHADISGNGTVFTEDFTFVQINFLKASEPNCCGAPLRPLAVGEDQPRSSISVKELQSRGLGRLAVADVTGDGVVDTADISAWLLGARPGKPLLVNPVRRR